MDEPFEKLRVVTCVAVVAYRPHRTKKGHYIWKAHHCVGGPFSSLTELRDTNARWGNAPVGSIHNQRLTENEEIKAIAQDEKE